ETSFGKQEVQELVERAENDTHMLKLAEKFAETGEFPEKEETGTEEAVTKVLEENPDAVEDYRSGKESAINYLLGQVMQETNGKADGGEARQLIEEEIE
ncbi:MAG: Asp-tRNA(Asn)/Glu-tRNA(Gln) amidotransferase GatCAB subunit B, partial [Candidatus Nanohaloarchaea archaeon]